MSPVFALVQQPTTIKGPVQLYLTAFTPQESDQLIKPILGGHDETENPTESHSSASTVAQAFSETVFCVRYERPKRLP